MCIKQKILSNANKILLIAISFIICLSTIALAAPKLFQILRFYRVTGLTNADIIYQLNTKGPVKFGQRFRAYTSWSVKWDPIVELRGGKCYLNSITTSINVTFNLPNWIDRNKASKELRDKWDLYIKNLIMHEYGHRDYGMAAAAKIEKDLKKLPHLDNCEDFMASLDKEVKFILYNAHLMEIDYDVKTQHGRTQGAFFQ